MTRTAPMMNRSARTMTNALRRLMPMALMALAGSAAQAQTLTWTGTCGSNWFDQCVVGICNGNQNLNSNNFGQLNCTFSPPFPVATNAVFLGSNAVTLNGTASVASLDLAAGGTLTITSGDLNPGSGFNQRGTVVVSGGDHSLYGGIANQGSFTWNAGTWYWQSQAFNNTGTLSATGGSWSNWTGTNSLISTGQIIKTGGGDLSQTIPTTLNGGTVSVQAGRVFWQNAPTTINPSVSWEVFGGAELRFRNATLNGTVNAVSNGFMGQDASCSILTGGSLTLNVNGSSGWQWPAGDLQMNGSILTNTGKMSMTAGGDRSTLNGQFRNQSDLSVGSFTWYFQSTALLNTGTIDAAGGNWSNWTGTNSHTLSGAGVLRKTSANSLTHSVPFTGVGGGVSVENGALIFQSTSTSFAPAVSINVANPGQLLFRNSAISGTINAGVAGFMGIDASSNLGGPLTLNVTGNGFNWSAGDLQLNGNTLTNNQTFARTGGDSSILNGTLINNGQFSYTAGTWYFQGINLNNNAGGTISVTGGSWPNWTGTNTFTNSGTLTKLLTAAPARDLSIAIPTANNGTINVQGNTVSWNSAPFTANNTGQFNVSSGAGFFFRNCSIKGTLNGTNNGSFGFDTSNALSDDLTINIAGSNGFNWFAGDLQLNGKTLTVAPLRTMNYTGGDRSVLNGSIVNQGIFLNTAGTWYFQGLNFTNNGSFTFSSGSMNNWTGTNLFTNNGSFIKTGNNSRGYSVPTVNNGLFDVSQGDISGVSTYTQNAGQTFVRGGGMTGGQITVNGGDFYATGTVSPLTNNGGVVYVDPTTTPAVGTLNVQGRFIQGPGGMLVVDIGSTTSADVISSQNNPSVQGNIVARVLNSTEVRGLAYTIITGTGFTPAFASPGIVSTIGTTRIARVQPSGLNVVLYFVCSPADISDDQGNIPPQPGVPNNGITEGDYNAFFSANGFFAQSALGLAAINGTCDIANDQGDPLPTTPDRPNNGVNEGDYNLFFNLFFLGCD
ncbi:MAG: hypothetical protein IBJ18_04540 [Phycisphaerales bacterium]|nr:hypothetical protein [Phycisphaerales bacterium]